MKGYQHSAILFLLFFLWSSAIYSQQCWTSERRSHFLNRDIEHQQKYDLLQKKIALVESQFITNRKSARLSGAVITIPVVVHVVYRTTSENISDEQIYSQIEVLNKDFRSINTDIANVPAEFRDRIADVELEFCLAGSDPSGSSTTGITRTQTMRNDIGITFGSGNRLRVHYDDLGGKDGWNPQKYLNIWVCDMGEELLGTATIPGTADAAEDGVVIDTRVFGTVGTAVNSVPTHLGRTCTHEIGHYFNLEHLWGNDFDDCNTDDLVSDTPPQLTSSEGCPIHPRVSCMSNDMFMNFMDYSDDDCLIMFTNGQKTRMLAALTSARPGLMSSVDCADITSVKYIDSSSDLNLSPNPSNGQIRLSWEHISGEYRMRVIDIQGRLMLESMLVGNHSHDIDMSSFPPGAYFLELTHQRKRAVKKLLLFQ